MTPHRRAWRGAVGNSKQPVSQGLEGGFTGGGEVSPSESDFCSQLLENFGWGTYIGIHTDTSRYGHAQTWTHTETYLITYTTHTHTHGPAHRDADMVHTHTHTREHTFMCPEAGGHCWVFPRPLVLSCGSHTFRPRLWVNKLAAATWPTR